MPFDLWTDGATLVDRAVHLFDKRAIARDPMSGIVDGSNTLFYIKHPPVLSSGSIGVYTTGSDPVASSQYTVDYDAGLVEFVTAPSVQPTATYHTARYSDLQIKSIMVAGFDEMEGQWFRGLSLSSVIGTGQIIQITEDSPFAYVVNTSGSDPQIGSIYFGQSRTQLNFYTKCVQLAFYRSLLPETALNGLIWTEAQGLRIDRTKVTPNLKLAIDSTEKAVVTAMNSARFEWYGDAAFGYGILSPQTEEFAAHKFWQGQSISQDWRGTTKYTGNRF